VARVACWSCSHRLSCRSQCLATRLYMLVACMFSNRVRDTHRRSRVSSLRSETLTCAARAHVLHAEPLSFLCLKLAVQTSIGISLSCLLGACLLPLNGSCLVDPSASCSWAFVAFSDHTALLACWGHYPSSLVAFWLVGAELLETCVTRKIAKDFRCETELQVHRRRTRTW
jgi:hypothetical protein